MNPEEAVRLRDILETNSHVFAQAHRTTHVVTELAKRLLTYLEHKVDPASLKDELYHEEEGLRILINLDKRLLAIFRRTAVAPIITMHERDCRVLLDLFVEAEHDPERVNYDRLEKTLKDMYWQDAQMSKAA